MQSIVLFSNKKPNIYHTYYRIKTTDLTHENQRFSHAKSMSFQAKLIDFSSSAYLIDYKQVTICRILHCKRRQIGR